MATYTRNQLRDAVLHELGVLAADEAPTATDAELADDRCQQCLEFLYDQGKIGFDLDGAIPGRAFQPLVYIIAYRLMRPYGKDSAANVLAANAKIGMVELSQIKAQPYLGAPQVAEYF